MSTTAIADRFTALPDEHVLRATVVALEEHGFSVEVVGAQKLVPTLAAAHQRIYQHSLLLEDARAQAAWVFRRLAGPGDQWCLGWLEGGGEQVAGRQAAVRPPFLGDSQDLLLGGQVVQPVGGLDGWDPRSPNPFPSPGRYAGHHRHAWVRRWRWTLIWTIRRSVPAVAGSLAG